MCYAIPGKVVELKNKVAIVDYFGELRDVINEFPEINVGDYIYAQGGFIIQKISEDKALPILKLWKNKLFHLMEVDEKTSGADSYDVSEDIKDIINKSLSNEELSKEDLLKLMNIDNQKDLDFLFSSANKVRKDKLKNSCCVHGIIEFSNFCPNNCSYCGIRKDNNDLVRYRMSADEIVDVADHAINKLGFKALVLQSGEDPHYTIDVLVDIIKRIKNFGVLIFVSVGSRSLNDYKLMYDAGARGVLLRFESSNKIIYDTIHEGPKADFVKRIEVLKYCYSLGYLIVTGSLIGLPKQSNEDIINDILLTKELNAEMFSFGPLIPHKDTPLRNEKLVDINNMLKVIAISRLLDPDAKIHVTTALETLSDEGRKLGMLSGANSLMINVTPKKFRDNYDIYPGRHDRDKEITKNISETINFLYSIGRAPTDLGN